MKKHTILSPAGLGIERLEDFLTAANVLQREKLPPEITPNAPFTRFIEELLKKSFISYAVTLQALKFGNQISIDTLTGLYSQGTGLALIPEVVVSSNYEGTLDRNMMERLQKQVWDELDIWKARGIDLQYEPALRTFILLPTDR